MIQQYRTRHQEIVEACAVSQTYTEVEHRLGIIAPTNTLRRYIKQHQIPMPKYLGRSAASRLSQSGRKRRGLEIFRENTTINNSRAKQLLFRHGLKEQKCEICGWAEARSADGLIPVHLHHINGDSRDF